MSGSNKFGMGALPPGVTGNTPDPQTAIDRQYVRPVAQPQSPSSSQSYVDMMNRARAIRRQAKYEAANPTVAQRPTPMPQRPMQPPPQQVNPKQPTIGGFRDNPVSPSKPGGMQTELSADDIMRYGTNPRPAFKKGGKVAAKAPVKKAMGGPIKAKPAAKPAAKMAKSMPAMKRGGKVMAKGRKR